MKGGREKHEERGERTKNGEKAQTNNRETEREKKEELAK